MTKILFLIVNLAEQASRGNKSWGELVEEAEARTPGHGVHMHEKLSSPSRKRYYGDKFIDIEYLGVLCFGIIGLFVFFIFEEC